jgi:predicted oxidoreductase
MNTIALGSSALRSSRLAYGCWRIVGAGKPAELTPEREDHARQAILAAVEAGFTLFDHADIYSDGLAETVFGNVLKNEPGLRDRILIASKCGVRRAGQPAADVPYRYDLSADHIIHSCEDSLQRLQTDRIDLYQIHRVDWLADPGEIAEAFSTLKQQGKVREFGVSNALPAFVSLLQKHCPMRLLVNQVEISLLKLDFFQNGLVEQCLAEKITPLAWSPLAAGRLCFSNPIELNDPGHAHRIRVRETVDHLARAHNVPKSVIGLAWLLRHPAGIVPIIGSTNPANIRDAAKADALQLSREEWYMLIEAACGHRLP